MSAKMIVPAGKPRFCADWIASDPSLVPTATGSTGDPVVASVPFSPFACDPEYSAHIAQPAAAWCWTQASVYPPWFWNFGVGLGSVYAAHGSPTYAGPP